MGAAKERVQEGVGSLRAWRSITRGLHDTLESIAAVPRFSLEAGIHNVRERNTSLKPLPLDLM